MKKFWVWYEKNYKLNLGVTTGLFILQLAHLFWLTAHVVWQKLFGTPLFSPGGIWQSIIVLVDYTEIPALISVSLVYIHKLQKEFSWKSVFFLFALNVQVIHMFWITDEFVVSAFTGIPSAIPSWFAWIAILIDYLELPVMFETTRLFLKELIKGNKLGAFEAIKNSD